MLDFELPETGITAAQWREQDSRYACASCLHCKDNFTSGFYCAAIEEFLSESGAPVTRVTIDTAGICDGYELDLKQFYENEREYPNGFDPAELCTDPDEGYYKERTNEHAAA